MHRVSLVTAHALRQMIMRRECPIVVLDCTYFLPGTAPAKGPSANELFLAERLMHAKRFDIDAIVAAGVALPHAVPTQAEFQAVARGLGITADTRVVVYDRSTVAAAPHARWMFRYFGHADTLVLEGGLSAARAVLSDQWFETRSDAARRAGPLQRLLAAPVGPYDASAFPHIRTAATGFRAEPNPQMKAERVVVAEVVAQTRAAQLVDARSSARFTASAPEPRPGLRGGHMPGAINVPFAKVLDPSGRYFLAPEALRHVFAAAGVDLAKPIIFTCGSGVTANIVSMAAEMAGASGTRSTYSGSWSEWGQTRLAAECPVVV